MIARPLVRIDLKRKLAFSTKLKRRDKTPNQFGFLLRRGESERADERLERTLQVIDNPNADTTGLDFADKNFGAKYGPYIAEAMQMKNAIDIEAIMQANVQFRQRDIYGHYQTSSMNAVDPYNHDDFLIALTKYKALRTKEQWKEYKNASERVLEEYSEKFKELSDISPTRNRMEILDKLWKKIGFEDGISETLSNGFSKSENDQFKKLIDGKKPLGELSEDFNVWSIYFAAHKMMETEMWSMSLMDQSEEFLKSICMGPFYQQLKADCFNKTIKWKLNDFDPNETKLIGMDSMPTDLGQIYTAHLYMKSKQSLEVYDRMGNELIYDTEPRLCEEIVTFIFQRPDPFWYGWRLMDKRNVSTLADNLPNMKRTSSVRAQKKQMQVLERFMRDEAHQSYDIFTGTRKETEARRYDYYHRGWNYGGTQESDGPTGTGSLEWKFSKLDFHEKRHPDLAFNKFTGRNKEWEYFERHDDRFQFSHRSRTGRQIRRKRTKILHKRKTGEIRPTRMGSNIWEIDQPQPK